MNWDNKYFRKYSSFIFGLCIVIGWLTLTYLLMDFLKYLNLGLTPKQSNPIALIISFFIFAYPMIVKSNNS